MQREVVAAGHFGILFIAFFSFFGFYTWFQALVLYPYIVGLLPLIAVFAIHFARSDHHFWQINFANNKVGLFAAEYIGFSAPFWIVLLFSNPFLGLSYFVFCPLIAFFSAINLKTVSIFLPLQFIPNTLFEIKSAFRQQFLFWGFIFILSLGGFWHPAPPIIAWILLLFSLPNVYREAEPWTMLVIRNYTPSQFIFNKLKCHSLFYLTYSAPGLLIFFLFQFNFLWVVLIFFFLLIFNVFFNICCKYAFYESASLQSTNQLWLSIGLVSMLLPPLLPLPFILTIRFYRKSVIKLAKYLNVND